MIVLGVEAVGPTDLDMEKSQTTTRLRASMLWMPGLLAVILGVSIHTHVESLRERDRAVVENPVVCWLPVDLAEPSAQQILFMPSRHRRFVVRLVLTTALPTNQSTLEPADDDSFPDNAISQTLGTATLAILWKIRSEGQRDIEGVISERDLRTRIQGDDIRYVFGDQTVGLVAGRGYQLIAEGAGQSPELNDFAPTVMIEAIPTLKGHPLAGWRLRDSGLLLLLGVSLISLGVSKRYSDRKRRRIPTQLLVTSESDS